MVAVKFPTNGPGAPLVSAVGASEAPYYENAAVIGLYFVVPGMIFKSVTDFAAS